VNGTVRTLVSFDYESPDVQLAVDYVVTVTDGGSPVALSSSTSLRLVIADVNDHPPVFTVDHYHFEVGLHSDTFTLRATPPVPSHKSEFLYAESQLALQKRFRPFLLAQCTHFVRIVVCLSVVCLFVVCHIHAPC